MVLNRKVVAVLVAGLFSLSAFAGNDNHGNNGNNGNNGQGDTSAVGTGGTGIGLGIGAADASAGAVAGSKASTNGTVTNEMGGDTTNVSSKLLWLPTHTVAVPPSLVAGAVVTTSVGACGVMQDVVNEKVEGTFNGILFDSKVDLGHRGMLKPASVPFKEYKHGNLVFLIGHQPIIFSAVISTSGARQFGLGTNSGSGSGGSGSAGSSSGMQQMVQQIQLTECILSQVDTGAAAK